MVERLTKKQLENIVKYAEDFIESGKPNDWISISSLIRRSYYWGLINGLESMLSSEDLDWLAGKMIKNTFITSELDEKIQAAIVNRK